MDVDSVSWLPGPSSLALPDDLSPVDLPDLSPDTVAGAAPVLHRFPVSTIHRLTQGFHVRKS